MMVIDLFSLWICAYGLFDPERFEDSNNNDIRHSERISHETEGKKWNARISLTTQLEAYST